MSGVMLLVFMGAWAMAESNIDVFDDAYMYQNGFANENGRFYFQSMDWDGETCYAYLTDQKVYTYKPGEDLNYLCTLPGVPENLSMIHSSLTEIETDQLYDSVTYIAAYAGNLYGYNVYSGKYGRIDETGIHWSDVSLDFSCLFHRDRFFPDGILQNIVTDNELYTFVLKSDDYDSTYLTLYAFDLQTGKSREIAVDGLCGVCRGNDNDLLCLRWLNGAYRISCLNPQSGKVFDSDFALGNLAVNEIIGGIAYDPYRNTVCVASGGYIYKCDANSEFTVFARFASNGITPEVSAWLLPDGRYAILCDGLHIREEGAINERRLSIAGGVVPQALNQFTSVYSDIPVQFFDWMNAEEIAQRVTTQDNSIDIYIVKVDSTFTAMKSKGYAAPLESSDTITRAVANMDSSIRTAISDESGHIVAYPSELGIWFYGINEGYWNMLWPDRPLPESFDDLLDAWIEWEREYAQEYPGVGFVDIDFDYSYWIYTLVSDYVMQHDTDALPNLNAPSLRSALEKMREVYEIRLSNGRSTSWDEPDTQIMVESETGPGCIFKRSILSAMSNKSDTGLTTSEEYLYGVLKGSVTQIPIVFDESSVPQTSGRMYAYVVNPYSEHIEDAVRFIECMTYVEGDPQLYYAIHPNENAPYPNPEYAHLRDAYMKQRESYENAIQRAINENKDYDVNMVHRIQFYDQWLDNENNQWLINKETIDTFRADIANAPLNLHAESPYICDEGTNSFSIVMGACNKYADGHTSLDAFLNEISSKMKMIHMEEQ